MAHVLLSFPLSLTLPLVEADPGSPRLGQMWLRTDTGEVKFSAPSGTKVLSTLTQEDVAALVIALR